VQAAVYAGMTMDAISGLPMLDDIDADYSPQYVKLARIIRAKIEAGQYKHGQRMPAASLMSEHKVSRQVAYAALAMLAANRYITQQAPFKPYQVTWHAARSHNKTSVNKIKPPASRNIRAIDPRQ
jgi:DNA-binding FadR family transcriptional regulator